MTAAPSSRAKRRSPKPMRSARSLRRSVQRTQIVVENCVEIFVHADFCALKIFLCSCTFKILHTISGVCFSSRALLAAFECLVSVPASRTTRTLFLLTPRPTCHTASSLSNLPPVFLFHPHSLPRSGHSRQRPLQVARPAADLGFVIHCANRTHLNILLQET